MDNPNKLFIGNDKKHAYNENKYRISPYNVMEKLYPNQGLQKLQQNFVETQKDYRYWKNRLKECNAVVIGLKKLMTAIRISVKDQEYICDSIVSGNVYISLAGWRNYYKMAQDQYAHAKYQFLLSQKYLNQAKFDLCPSMTKLQRYTYDEYKEQKEYNYGAGSVKGFKKWLATNLRDVLEHQYKGQEAYDIVDCDLKRTYNWWNKFFEMYEKGEKPSDKRLQKSKDLKNKLPPVLKKGDWESGPNTFGKFIFKGKEIVIDTDEKYLYWDKKLDIQSNDPDIIEMLDTNDPNFGRLWRAMESYLYITHRIDDHNWDK